MWFEVTGRELRNALGDALDLEACVVLTRTRDKDQTVVGIELVIDISQCIMEIMFKLRQHLLGVSIFPPLLNGRKNVTCVSCCDFFG